VRTACATIAIGRTGEARARKAGGSRSRGCRRSPGSPSTSGIEPKSLRLLHRELLGEGKSSIFGSNSSSHGSSACVRDPWGACDASRRPSIGYRP
jgi:hypothetical protein